MTLRDDLLTPIEGENPSGTYVGFEPIWDEIKEARKEGDDLPQGEWATERKSADYAKVLKLASDVLATQSKDLQLATWLTEAAIRAEGASGLREGLELLTALLEQFWDTLYPELEDGDTEARVNQLAWLSTHRFLMAVWSIPLNGHGHGFLDYTQAKEVGKEAEASTPEAQTRYRETVESGGVTGDDFEAGFEASSKAWYKQIAGELDGSLAALKALDGVGDEKFGHDAPGYQKLRQAIESVQGAAKTLLARKLEQDPDPVEVEEESLDTAAPVAEDGAAGTGGEGMTLDPKSDNDAAKLVTAAAQFLQKANPCNPAPYLMVRGFRWGELRANGDALDPRMLEAPPTAIRTRLKGLLLDAKWPQLLQIGESVMSTPNGRGWIDLQRYTLTACQNLGHEYDAVAAAIRGALTQLLRDLPDLLDHTLMDDTPTANAETKAWLRDAGVLAAAAAPDEATGEPGAVEVSAAPARSYGKSVSDRAADLVRAGQPQKAVELLMQEAGNEKSERARFYRRSEAAGVLVDAGYHAVALPILRELLTTIDNQHGLEGWEEGSAIARPLNLLQQSIKEVEGESHEAQELYVRVCRLDPLQAMAPPAPPPAPEPPPPAPAAAPQADGGPAA